MLTNHVNEGWFAAFKVMIRAHETHCCLYALTLDSIESCDLFGCESELKDVEIFLSVLLSRD